MSSESIKIGVFVPSGAQALDVACVDILGTMSKEYLSVPPASLMPPGILELAPATEVAYITTPLQGFDIPLTSSMVVRATHSYTDAAVAPSKLEMVVVPGPHLAAKHLSAEFDEGGLTWLRQQSHTPGVDILCICSGILVCGAAGIADGKDACGSRDMQAFSPGKIPPGQLCGRQIPMGAKRQLLVQRERHEWKRPHGCVFAVEQILASKHCEDGLRGNRCGRSRPAVQAKGNCERLGPKG